MLEIYNEKVQDLLITDPKLKPSGGLKVRETPSGAVYVQGLSKHPVDSYEMIQRKMDEGYNNRSIGSTLMMTLNLMGRNGISTRARGFSSNRSTVLFMR